MMNDYFVISKYHSFFILTPPPPRLLYSIYFYTVYTREGGGMKEKLTNSLQISDKIVRGDTAGI